MKSYEPDHLEGRVGEADTPGPGRGVNPDDEAKRTMLKEYLEQLGTYIPTKSFRGRKEGFHFKMGDVGLGYYADNRTEVVHDGAHDILGNENGNKTEIFLDVLIVPTDQKEAINLDEQPRQRIPVKKKKMGSAKVVTVNPNALTTLEDYLNISDEEDIHYIAVQETKMRRDEEQSRETALWECGWKLHHGSCAGTANGGRSGGVAMIARKGLAVADVFAEMEIPHVKPTSRLGAWVIEAGPPGGLLMVVVYLHTTLGPWHPENAGILDQVRILIRVAGRPYCIAGDWNTEPDQLEAQLLEKKQCTMASIPATQRQQMEVRRRIFMIILWSVTRGQTWPWRPCTHR